MLIMLPKTRPSEKLIFLKTKNIKHPQYMEKRYFCSPEIFITSCSFTLNISKFISDENCAQRERCVFISSRADEKAASSNPNPINHAMITKCISQSFEKAEVFRGTSTYQHVSCAAFVSAL